MSPLTGLTPPGPARRQALRAIARDRRRFMLEAAVQYGGVVNVRIPLIGHAVYLLGDPAYIQHVLVDNWRNYRRGVSPQKVWYGNSVGVADGEYHLRQRRLMQPMLHRQRVTVYADLIADLTAAQLAAWEPGLQPDIYKEILDLASRIICACIFGAQTPELDSLRECVNILVETTSKLDIFPLGRRLQAFLPRYRRNLGYQREANAQIFDLIARRRQEPGDGQDLLDMLLRSEYDDGTGMDDQTIRNELVNLFVAGHKTTTLAVIWALYLLARHPLIQNKLAAELDRVLQGRPLTLADRPNLPYLHNVISETLRMYPPVWHLHARVAIQDDEIGGYPVPAGTTLLLVPGVMHYHPHHWESPDAFRPERFDEAHTPRPNRFVYFPFGIGLHLCLGEPLAWMEAEYILSAILTRFRVQLASDKVIVPGRSLLNRPDSPMALLFSARSQTQ